MRSFGYTVLETGDPLEAVQLVKAQPVDPLLTDVSMPSRKGIDLADGVQAASPRSRVKGDRRRLEQRARSGRGELWAGQRKRSISSCSATIWLPLVEEGTMISVFTPAAYQASTPSRTSDALP